MASDEGGEKTHDATEKKKRDSAEKGQMAKSREITSVAILLFGAGALVFAYEPMVTALTIISRQCFTVGNVEQFTMVDARGLAASTLEASAKGMAAPLLMVVIAALVAGLGQTQFQMATKALEPKLDRLDIFAGFKNQYMSWNPLVELAKGLVKLILLGIIVGWAMADEIETLPRMAMMDPSQILLRMTDLAWQIILSAMPLLFVVAAADFAYQKWKTADDLKMSTQELRQEQKDETGDPHQKSARKQRARQIALGNALRQVKEADVVITNPTHYAVALRYRKEEGSAPRILAMGLDHLALKIRREARAHDIPCVENRPLARSLYAKGKLDAPIPEDLYGAVAQILAAIYRRRLKRGQKIY